MKAIFEQGIRAGDHAAAGIGAGALGGIAFLAGRYRDAARWIAEAEVHFEQHDTFGLLLVGWAYQVGIARFTGDGDGVARALARCEEALKEHGPASQPASVCRPRASLGRRRPGRQSRRAAPAPGRRSVALGGAHIRPLGSSTRRCGAAPGRARSPLRCRTCAIVVTPGSWPHTPTTPRPSPPGRGRRCSRSPTSSSGSARSATPPRRRPRPRPAFLQAGRQDSARRAAARSRELFVDAQGGTPPPIEGLDGPAVELTARETQLVELARQGLTNAEIAERLVLSVRTVESHLYRAMQKLGISDRREL